MRLVLQRVSRASVIVEAELVADIGPGLLILAGVSVDDGPGEVTAAVDKVSGLRIFPDEEGKMSLSVLEAGASALVVSQFTLIADTARGRRPSFTAAARPEQARPLIESLAAALRSRGVPTETGRFGAMMDVELVNHGPVTIVIEVREGRVL